MAHLARDHGASNRMNFEVSVVLQDNVDTPIKRGRHSRPYVYWGRPFGTTATQPTSSAGS
jgi:hypothetical protein